MQNIFSFQSKRVKRPAETMINAFINPESPFEFRSQLNIVITQPQRPFEYRVHIGLITKCSIYRKCLQGSHRNDFPLLAH